MKGKTLCIVIALMVLSLGAILVANPGIFGEFQIKLNGVSPIKVTLTRLAGRHMGVYTTESLRKGALEGTVVHFTGVIAEADTGYGFQFDDDVFSVSSKDVRKLRIRWTLQDAFERKPLIEVYPLDAPNLPEEYQPGDKYEFTGFLMRYEAHLENSKCGWETLRVYAFRIQREESEEDGSEEDGSVDFLIR